MNQTQVRVCSDIRAVNLSQGIAGAYCAKLFADLGAEVVKVEPSEGDRWRRRVNGTILRPGETSSLFKFLHAGQRSMVGAPGDDDVRDVCAGADLVIDSGAATDMLADLRHAHPELVVVSVTPYGLTGPWAARASTPFIVEAESGSIVARGRPGSAPIQAGGQLMEWLTGTYAAVASLAALIKARRTKVGESIDVSAFETAYLAGGMAGDLRHHLAGRPPIDGPLRSFEAPSIERTSDGWIGFCTNSYQQFEGFLLLIDRPDLATDSEWFNWEYRSAHLDEWAEITRPWMLAHTTLEVFDTATALRIPVARVNDGREVLRESQFLSRDVFRRSADNTFTHPVPPYLIDGVRPGTSGKHPEVGQQGAFVGPSPAPTWVAGDTVDGLPLAGLRVVDSTGWWAGPSCGHILGALGAEVIHLESCQHPDGARMVVGSLQAMSDWWERSSLFLFTNTNKKSVAVDLSTDDGLSIVRQLIASADVVVENYSPRVFDKFGLTWDRLSIDNPGLILTRMPAFGLDGPMRDNVGFAQTMEQMTGLAWVTGAVDDQPRVPRGPCDPMAGMHAAFAVLAALARRTQTGMGALVEVPMVETALNAAAEQVIEFSAHGHLLERDGNRGPDAVPQGLYRCRGTDTWAALAVETDAQWEQLVEVLGSPNWSKGPELSTAAGRRESHDLLDKELAAWFATHDVYVVTEKLVDAGVPAGMVRDPRLASLHPQFRARRFFEEVDHPVVGPHLVGAIPFRYASVDHWVHHRAPLLGEHNFEVLTSLGFDSDRIAQLERAGITGTVPAGQA